MTTDDPGTVPETLLSTFPLVPRPRPTCPPLLARIERVAWFAASTDPSRTAAAHNLAALVAADCGHPDLSRELCWLHHDRYPTDRPWTDRETRWALEPLINLTRLHVHGGSPDSALAILHDLLAAHRCADDTAIDGRLVTLRHLRPGGDDHRSSHRWLWGVVLAEGIRALTRAARWDDALAHARRHHGIGTRMLDGRQTAALVMNRRGHRRAAVQVLSRAQPGEPWEQVVRSTLHLLIEDTGPGRGLRAEHAVQGVLLLDPGPEHASFLARLGLVIHALVQASDPGAASRVGERLHELGRRDDAYVARDLLAGGFAHHLPPQPRQRLARTRAAAGLDHTTPRHILRGQLLSALRSARP